MPTGLHSYQYQSLSIGMENIKVSRYQEMCKLTGIDASQCREVSMLVGIDPYREQIWSESESNRCLLRLRGIDVDQQGSVSLDIIP